MHRPDCNAASASHSVVTIERVSSLRSAVAEVQLRVGIGASPRGQQESFKFQWSWSCAWACSRAVPMGLRPIPRCYSTEVLLWSSTYTDLAPEWEEQLLFQAVLSPQHSWCVKQ